MKIMMYIPGMPFNGAWLEKGLSLGGSESAALFMARALSRLGHTVTMFTQCTEELEHNGVSYRFAGPQTEAMPLGTHWHKSVTQPHDVCIVQRAPLPFNGHEQARLRLWWLHDLALLRQRPLVDLSLPFIDKILCVSEFHKRQVAQTWEIDPGHIVATQNGVDYALVEKAVKNTRRGAKQLVFASRPERGLSELLEPGGIMDKLPDYTLHICTYANVAPHMADYYQNLLQRAQTMPNVVNHGHLGKTALYRLLAGANAYVYPTTFEDTSNIMLLEANACGTPFIALENLGALPETGQNGALVEVPAVNGRPCANEFAAAARKICENETLWQVLSDRAKNKRQDWRAIALNWQNLFERELSAKTAQNQSLALCMLVRNAALDLPRAVQSAAAICDEIIIGVDDNTTDDTVAVCRALNATVIPVESPLKTGFDAARNTIMEHATAHWLLWLDSDEILDNPENLRKYLQPSPVEALALPQHHFAAEPAGLLKTDYPARLFRNRKGFRFYGMVHEHPEKGLNMGLGRAVKISDAAIIHQGYFNETIRRQRFVRNWPLLQQDRAKYPQRKLGQMLWLRDLAHMMRYSLEQGDKPFAIAKAITAFWAEFAPAAPLQLQLEALPYYSEAVQYLHGTNAVEVKFSLSAGKAFVNNSAVSDVHGFFPNAAAAQSFLNQAVTASLNNFDAQYF